MVVSLSIIFGVVAAVFHSVKNLSIKHVVGRTDAWLVVFASRIVGVGLFLVVILGTGSFLVPGEHLFWLATGVAAVLRIVENYFIARALAVSDISIVSPLLAFIPVASVPPAVLILGEVPTLLAGVGIVLVSLGAYLLNVEQQGVMASVTALWNDQGARYILVAVILFSAVPAIDKVALSYAGPLHYTFFLLTVMSGLLLVVLEGRKQSWRASAQRSWRGLALVGAATGLMLLAIMFGYQTAHVSYIQAFKRVSVVLSILVGWVLFEEDGYLPARLLGGVIMVMGAVLITVGM